MKNKLIVFVFVLALLLSPQTATHAGNTSSADSAEVKTMMEMLQQGNLDADAQVRLSELIGQKDGKFLKGDKIYHNASAWYWVMAAAHIVFAVLIFMLLFFVNALLFQKLTHRTGKKKK